MFASGLERTSPNFEGPIADCVPETWSKIGDLFHDAYLYGRGLDAGRMGGGAVEMNTVPQLVAAAKHGTRHSKLPRVRRRR